MNKTDSGDTGGLVLWLALTLPVAAFRGWVIAVLWGWFIAPLGVSAIGVWWGAGLSLLLSFVSPSTPRDPLESLTAAVGRVARDNISHGLTALLFGLLYRALAF